jgi:hypothetical protein
MGNETEPRIIQIEAADARRLQTQCFGPSPTTARIEPSDAWDEYLGVPQLHFVIDDRVDQRIRGRWIARCFERPHQRGAGLLKQSEPGWATIARHTETTVPVHEVAAAPYSFGMGMLLGRVEAWEDTAANSNTNKRPCILMGSSLIDSWE